MKCGNLMQQRITRIQTEQANEIARLIKQYITIDQRMKGVTVTQVIISIMNYYVRKYEFKYTYIMVGIKLELISKFYARNIFLKKIVKNEKYIYTY